MKIRFVSLVFIALLIAMIGSGLVRPAYAGSLSYDTTDTFDRGYIDLGSGSTPPVYYNGSRLLSSDPYVWSSDDPSVVSFDMSNRQYTAHVIGDTRLTISYNGDSTNFDVKVRHLTRFTGRPQITTIPVLDIAVSVSASGLHTRSDQTLLPNKLVSFYTTENPSSSGFLCSAMTDTTGSASCSITPPQRVIWVYAYFAGDNTYAPASTETSE